MFKRYTNIITPIKYWVKLDKMGETIESSDDEENYIDDLFELISSRDVEEETYTLTITTRSGITLSIKLTEEVYFVAYYLNKDEVAYDFVSREPLFNFKL